MLHSYTHRFEIALVGVTEVTPKLKAKLYRAGCGDAAICTDRGELYLRFARIGLYQQRTIETAEGDVKRAGYTPRLVTYALPE